MVTEQGKRDTHERILAAARDLFRTSGYERTTMDAVATRAGVSKGAVFFHARSKAALLNQVFQVDMQRWVLEAFRQPEQAGILEDLVAKFASLQIAMCSQPELTREYMRHVAFAEDEHERASDTMSVVFALTEEIIEKAKSSDQIVDWIDTRQLAVNLFELYFMHQLSWVAPAVPPTTDVRDSLRPSFAAQIEPLLVRAVLS
jgi:AcrR family transcriptional regulator